MLKLNTTRTFKTPVPVQFKDESGADQIAKMGATFKVMPNDALTDEENADRRLLDLVLVDVHDVELADESGQLLQGDDLLNACRADPVISAALITAYSAQTVKKNLPKT